MVLCDSEIGTRRAGYCSDLVKNNSVDTTEQRKEPIHAHSLFELPVAFFLKKLQRSIYFHVATIVVLQRSTEK